MPHIDVSISWWMPVLLLAGLYLLWQYHFTLKGLKQTNFRFLLFFLPALALLLLMFQLASPQIKLGRDIFHDPVVLIATDQSASFKGGKFLNLEHSYKICKDSIYQFYRSKGFQLREVMFSEQAFLAKDSNQSFKNYRQDMLTSFKALKDFIQDSIPLKNIQAIFLFSDGRDNFSPEESEIADFSLPVFPVIFSPDSFQDLQLNSADLQSSLEASNVSNPYHIQVNWTSFGKLDAAPGISLVKEGEVFYSTNIKAAESGNLQGIERKENLSLPKSVWKKLLDAKDVKVVLQSKNGDKNTFNDTTILEETASSRIPKIWFLKSLSHVDEHWMVSILEESEEYTVETAWLKDIQSMNLPSDHQLWIHAEKFPRKRGQMKRIMRKKSPLVIYGQDRRGIFKSLGLPAERFRRFGGSSQIFILPEKQGHFQNMRLTLGSICDRPLWAPQTDSSFSCVISVERGGSKGCLLAKVKVDSLVFYRLVYAHFWGKLFHPSEPYTVKEQIKSLIQGTAEMVNRERLDLVVSKPERIYEDLPFELTADFHQRADFQRLSLTIQNQLKTLTVPMEDVKLGSHEKLFKVENLKLAGGGYYVQITAGDQSLWRDSLRVLPKKSLELKKVGFALETLEKIAAQSQGSLLTFTNPDSMSTAGFPELFSGQIKERRERTIPLYHSLIIFFIILALMSGYWLLRKKVSLD